MRQATFLQRFRWLVLAIAFGIVWIPLMVLRLLWLAFDGAARQLHTARRTMFPPPQAEVLERRSARLERLEAANWTPEAIVREAVEALKQSEPDPDLADDNVALEINGALACRGKPDYAAALRSIYAENESIVSFRVTGVSHFADGHTDVTVNEEHRVRGQVQDLPLRQPPPSHGIVTVVYSLRQGKITAVKLRTLDPRYRFVPTTLAPPDVSAD